LTFNQTIIKLLSLNDIFYNEDGFGGHWFKWIANLDRCQEKFQKASENVSLTEKQRYFIYFSLLFWTVHNFLGAIGFLNYYIYFYKKNIKKNRNALSNKQKPKWWPRQDMVCDWFVCGSSIRLKLPYNLQSLRNFTF